MEEQQGLRCGEANPNQGLRQPYRGPTTPRGGRGKERTQTAQGSRREGVREVRDHMLIVSVNPEAREDKKCRKPGKKEREEPKKSLKQPKGGVSAERGTTGILPPCTKYGDPLPRHQACGVAACNPSQGCMAFPGMRKRGRSKREPPRIKVKEREEPHLPS